MSECDPINGGLTLVLLTLAFFATGVFCKHLSFLSPVWECSCSACVGCNGTPWIWRVAEDTVQGSETVLTCKGFPPWHYRCTCWHSTRSCFFSVLWPSSASRQSCFAYISLSLICMHTQRHTRTHNRHTQTYMLICTFTHRHIVQHTHGSTDFLSRSPSFILNITTFVLDPALFFCPASSANVRICQEDVSRRYL